MSLFRHLEHLRYRRFLDASLDGELVDERARRVRAHVAACARCAHDVDVTTVIKRRLGPVRRLRPAAQRRPSDQP